MKTTIVWQNKQQLENLVADYTVDEAKRGVTQAVYEEAQIAFRNSQRMVPVDTGTLRRSGQIISPKVQGDTVTVVLGYGGAASDYALKQHENLFYRHKEGQSAKYLEIPVAQQAAKMGDNLKRRLQRILGR